MELQEGNAPDVLSEQKTAAELIKRIRKLRWIGMDEEADLVQVELASFGVASDDSVIAVPRDTD
jgi:hypothetical protein